MAFTDIDRSKYKNVMKVYVEKNRPPVELRGQMDFTFRIGGQSIEPIEKSKLYDSTVIERAFAKITYVKKTAEI